MVRVVVAAGVFAAGGLVWTDLVDAAGTDINATADPAKCDKQWGPPCYTPANGTITPVAVGDTVTWRVLDGTHTVTPVDSKAFGGSDDLTGPEGTFSVTFDRPGVFAYYCRHHGSVEDDGKTHHGMWGKIDVKGEATTTTATTTTTAPPAADPPRPEPKPDPGPPPPAPSPPPPPSGSAPPPSGSDGSGETAAGTGRKYVGPPPTAASPPPSPREAAAEPPAPEPAPPPGPKPPRADDRPDDDAGDPDAVAVPPDEAVLPPSPQFPTPDPAVHHAEAPEGAPQGDTVAILQPESGGGGRKVILIGTMIGVSAFALGVGGWKWAHRPSKYWPA